MWDGAPRSQRQSKVVWRDFPALVLGGRPCPKSPACRSPSADPQEDLSLPGWVYHDPEYFRGRDGAADPARLADRLPRQRHRRRRATGGRSSCSARASSSSAATTARSAPSPMSAATAARGWSTARRAARKRLTCPYHAWTYAADGRLIGVPHKEDYPGLDPAALGLIPVELEIWRGFLFVRLEGGGPERRRDDGALRGRDRALPASRSCRRSAGSRCGRATSTGRMSPTIIRTGCTSTSPIPASPACSAATTGSRRASMSTGCAGDLVERPSANLSERAYQALPARRTRAGAGSISSCGRTSRSTSIPTRSISCTSCRSARPRR